jgi:hypothetical protein
MWQKIKMKTIKNYGKVQKVEQQKLKLHDSVSVWTPTVLGRLLDIFLAGVNATS